MSSHGIGKVCVVGLGYIGLPTASVIASGNVEVVGVDIRKDVVDCINRGEIHIVEPDLESVTASAVKQGRLRASLQPEPADAFVIAVPTPFHDGKAGLEYVWAAARAVAPHLRNGSLVVLESTSPPGTTDRMVELLADARPDLRFPSRGTLEDVDVHIAYCPERVLPGRVLVELVENSRVIGGMTAACSQRAMELYRIFCKGELNVTDARTAEMCKLTENAFRDVNIAFANELSRVCDVLDIDVWELVRLANHHPRVNILQPGPGVGGHCIAVDPWFIVEAAPEETPLIRTARQVNDGKPKRIIGKIRSAVDDALKANRRPVVGLFGLSFKADVDDLRESPALAIAEEVASWNDCVVLVSEPNIRTLPPSLAGKADVRFIENVDDLVSRADIMVMLVNHKQYLNTASEALSQKVLIDTRGVWPVGRSIG